MNVEANIIDCGRVAYRFGLSRESCPPYRIERWRELWLAAWDEQQAENMALKQKTIFRRIDRFAAFLKAEV